MTRNELQSFLQSRYNRERWLDLLHELIPGTRPWLGEQPRTLSEAAVATAAQVAHITLADERKIAVLEIKVTGHVDLQRNRAGLRNLVTRFIDQQSAHGVLAFFVGESGDYRFSLVAQTSSFTPDGQLELNQTAPRRYTYLLGPGQACRTAVERLEILARTGASAKLEDLINAFKVEPLFKEFYSDYGKVFDLVEALLKPHIADSEKLRLFTQRLFNRLMFIAFVERKGWLRMGERTDYLAALWDSYQSHKTTSKEPTNFYRDRLTPLFFEGLNQADRPDDFVDTRFGKVPYLNGGLFEKADDGTDDSVESELPDEALAAILDTEIGLFSRYNFTVAESTPLEIDVAVDPEMLGKVFEELVTGRHEQGSYYTPKPIVAFMGRAALVEHLLDTCPNESRDAVEAFVHDHIADNLLDPEAIHSALVGVKVCDPACGSGAYLLGMLHELHELRSHIFASLKKQSPESAYKRRLEIIERNLYGVDLDTFAINIARLRLWLALAVEYEGETPPPLPNLDFKIEQGDALAAPAPKDLFQRPAVEEFRDKKAEYLRAHGIEKKQLREDLDRIKADLAVWQEADKVGHGFNWAIEFAEVFMPGEKGDNALRSGGFDIVVANPPYVRMELIKPLKPVLRKRFAHVHSDRADLYIYFYARAHELLRPGGVGAFISSNKWLRAGYGEPLRQHLLDQQAFRLVMDFGELPVFDSAATDAAIFLWQKTPRDENSTAWSMVKDLQKCYREGVREHFLSLEVTVPSEQFGENKPRLATGATADLRSRMESSGPKLGDLYKDRLGWGIKTGLNEAFIIRADVRDQLIRNDPGCISVIKPLLVGDDIRRFECHYRGKYLIFCEHGIDIDKYPSIRDWLSEHRDLPPKKNGKPRGLDHRAANQKWYELQQPQKRYEPMFNRPKIVYPDIGKECRFFLDTEGGYYVEATAFVIDDSDFYLLGVLNSKVVFSYLQELCAVLGDKDKGGRLRFKTQYIEKLPIPDASTEEREIVGNLAKEAQNLHGKRRNLAEQFLKALGQDPAESTSRNPLEQPWSLSGEEYNKRARKLIGRKPDLELFEEARDATAALTETITKIEVEIDARVATLYGLDAEDQRWAVKASPKDDKQTLLFNVLSKLKDKQNYFRFSAIQTAVNDAELEITDGSLKQYINEAVHRGIIHDAGRDWYSNLSEPANLERQAVAKLIRAVEKAFPLLDFSVWSTTQLNPWMHHLLAQPVHFLNAPTDALQTIGEMLRDSGWEVAINPPPSAARQLVRPGEKMVVLRPTLSRQPAAEKRQAPIEQILVDLLAENPHCGLMDDAEAKDAVARAIHSSLTQVAGMQRYAESRKIKSDEFLSVNQRH